MRAGILAAGSGTRLRTGGEPAPKALTAVRGRPLIGWVLADLDAAGVTETVIIVNDASVSVRDYVAAHPPRHALRWIVKTTPSSMYSFLQLVGELARAGDAGPFLVSTVDTIAPPGTFAAFVDRCRRSPPVDLVLALTTVTDDDNPLLVEVAGPEDGAIRAVGSGSYATGGYYLVRPAILREAAAARAANLPALRAFFAHLLARGYSLHGVCMPASIDVDRPADIAAAERLLETQAS